MEQDFSTQAQKIEKMQAQIDGILTWINQRKVQQLTFPLDQITKDIIGKDFLKYEFNLDYTSSSGQVFPNIMVSHNKKQELISTYPPLYGFIANPTTNVLTFQNLPFDDGSQVNLLSTDSLPAPLSDAVPYFIISKSGNTCKLSLSSGGSEINITDTGTGSHYLYLYII